MREAQLNLWTYLLSELDSATLNEVYVGDRLKRFFQREGIELNEAENAAEHELEEEVEEKTISKNKSAPGISGPARHAQVRLAAPFPTPCVK